MSALISSPFVRLFRKLTISRSLSLMMSSSYWLSAYLRQVWHPYGVLRLVEDEVRLQLLRIVRRTVGVTTIRRQEILDLLALLLLLHEATHPSPTTIFFSRSMVFLNSFRSALEVSSDP